jgi:hypothetical protein
MMNSTVTLRRLLAFVSFSVTPSPENQLPQAEGCVWTCDVLEEGAKFLDKDRKSEVAKELARCMEVAGEGGEGREVALVYLLRAWFNACEDSARVHLSEETVGRVRQACERALSGRFAALCGGTEHEANLAGLCYDIACKEGRMELLELCCSGSSGLVDMVGVVQRTSLP